MSRLLLTLCLMLNCVLGRIPGAYTGDTLYAKAPSRAFSPPHLRYTYNASNPEYINFTVYNNFDSPNMHMWVTANDLDSGDVVMLLPNSTWYFPTIPAGVNGFAVDNFVAIPLPSIGNTINIPLPGYFSSGRVWFADGFLSFYAVLDGNHRPAIQAPTAGIKPTDETYDLNWGYMELSYGPTMTGNVTTGTIVYVDISEVDFVGLPLGFALYGCEYGVQQVPGVLANGVVEMCSSINALPPPSDAIPAAPWNETCIIDSSGSPIRVVSPGDLNATRYNDFWNKYVDEVWTYYMTNNLALLNAYATPLSNCTVMETTDTLNCTGFSRGFTRPTANDIYSCATGPFQLTGDDNYGVTIAVPILCAAFNRGTFLLPGGNVQPKQPTSLCYSNDINNYYSKFVHENTYNGQGYAFPYDDVTPADEINQSGTIVDTAPLRLAMTVGGPVTSLIPATSLTGYSCPTYAAAPPSAAAPAAPAGPKTFVYNPVVPNPTCTVSTSAAVATSTAQPSQVEGLLGVEYTYLGCWTDSASNRTLQYQLDSYGMTLEYCAGNASSFGYALFGVEYMYQCFGDNVLNTNTSCPALATDCNMQCDGNNNQTCGGPNLINVYQIIPASNVSTSSSSSNATATFSTSSSSLSTTGSVEATTTSSVTAATSATTTTSDVLSTTSSTPLPTSTGTPTCDTIFLTPQNTTYRIYCNTTITGNNLDEQSPFSSFADCITLCGSSQYNSTCIGSVFTNGTDTSSCVLKSNTNTNGTANFQSRLRVKRASNQVVFEDKVYAAYHLVNPAVYQGPPAPPSPYTTSSTSSSGLITAVSPSLSASPPISPLLTSFSSGQIAHLFTPGGLMTAVSPSQTPSPAIPFLQGQGTCTARSIITQIAQVTTTVTTCPATVAATCANL